MMSKTRNSIPQVLAPADNAERLKFTTLFASPFDIEKERPARREPNKLNGGELLSRLLEETLG